jgi:hypothetical protein
MDVPQALVLNTQKEHISKINKELAYTYIIYIKITNIVCINIKITVFTQTQIHLKETKTKNSAKTCLSHFIIILNIKNHLTDFSLIRFT